MPTRQKMLVGPLGTTSDAPQPNITWEIRAKPALYLLIPLAIAAYWFPNPLWNTLLAGLISTILIAYAWARGLASGIQAKRTVRKQWVGVGDQLLEAFEVAHVGRLPAIWFELRDRSNLPNYHPSTVRSLWNRRTRWQDSAICTQRGQFRLGPWQIVTQDPFGLFQITHHYPLVTELFIYPPVHAGLPIPLPSGESEGQTNANGRAWEATTRVAGVRPYTTHDPFRWIHWPTSARSRELQVRQFDRDEGGDIWLLLDLEVRQQLGDNLDSTYEQAIIIAASLAALALSNNRAVGLAIYARRPVLIPPVRGHAQRWKLLRALAAATIDGTTDVATGLRDLARSARRGSSILIVTPTNSAELLPSLLDLRRRGIGQQVVVLERKSFGAEESNTALFESIRKLGVRATLQSKDALGQPIEGGMLQ